MERIRHVMHKGKDVIIFDFSGLSPGKEAFDLIERSIVECRKHPPNSILSITDVTDGHYDRDILEGMKRFSNETKDFTRRSCIVGITGMKKVAYRVVMKFSNRNLRIFNTLDQAMDYLVRD